MREKRARRIAVRSIGRGSPIAAMRADIDQLARLAVAVARSRRCEAITERNAAEGAEQWFLYECRCGRNVGRSLRGTLAGLRRGRLRPARLQEPNDGDDEIVRPGRRAPNPNPLSFFVALLLRMTNY